MVAIKTEPFNELSEAVLSSIAKMVPVPYIREDFQVIEKYVNMKFGILIGFTGDLKGKVLYKGDLQLFSLLGEAMFGMPLEGDMLRSFAGEFGNMISGGLCANVFEKGITIDINSPIIMEGDSKISGFKKGIELIVDFEGQGQLFLYILLD
jgi:chemotaxis protein CheX